MAAVAEHVCPVPVAGVFTAGAQVPGGLDHGFVVSGTAEQADFGCVPDAVIGQAGYVH